MSPIPKLVGIFNLSEDSFSGDGIASDTAEQIILQKINALISAGASVIDVGAVSTRPGASVITPNEELLRLHSFLPLIVSACKQHNIIVSLDSTSVPVLEFGIRCGINWLNDVSGGKNLELLRLAAKENLTYVAMHSLTIPADKAVVLSADPVAAVHRWIEELLETSSSAGLSGDKIIVDPGIGFGKTSTQSWELVKCCAQFKHHGVKLLVGHSRKSFYNDVTDRPFADRDLETQVTSFYLASQGVDYLRVHDVGGSLRALRVWEQLHK
jgi:dihydropteroate synthase